MGWDPPAPNLANDLSRYPCLEQNRERIPHLDVGHFENEERCHDVWWTDCAVAAPVYPQHGGVPGGIRRRLAGAVHVEVEAVLAVASGWHPVAAYADRLALSTSITEHPPAPPVESQHSCQPTVKLHMLPLRSMDFSKRERGSTGAQGAAAGFALPLSRPARLPTPARAMGAANAGRRRVARQMGCPSTRACVCRRRYMRGCRTWSGRSH